MKLPPHKKPEQLLFKFEKHPEKPIVHDYKIQIKGVAPQRINEVLSHAGYFPPKLLSKMPTRGHVEQRICSIDGEVKATRKMLETRKMHFTEITELQEDLKSLSMERGILKKLLE